MPLKTRFLSLIFFVLISGIALHAQISNTREIGLRFGGLNDFDFIYKKQLTEHAFRRIRVALAEISFDITDDVNLFSFRTGIAWGKEKRRSIAEGLIWVHGWEPRVLLQFNLRSYRDDNIPPQDADDWDLAVSPGIGYILGFQYAFSDHFYVSLESIPSFGLNFTSRRGEALNSLGMGANFSFDHIALTLAYSFVPAGKASSSQ